MTQEVHAVAVCFDPSQVTSAQNRSNPRPGDPCHTISATGDAPSLASELGVRRLTPRECERLQGFPDDWTLVEHRGRPAKDSPRYRAIGNSMAVPVMEWIARRIARVEGSVS